MSGNHSQRAWLEAEHKWRVEDAQSMDPCPLHAPWVHGTAVLAAGGASVQRGAFPSHSMWRKGRKTCSALKLPCNESRDGSRNVQWRKNLVIPGAQQGHTAQHKVKGGSFSMPGGQVESGMELPQLQPLCLCAQHSSWTQRCAVPSWGPLSLMV